MFIFGHIALADVTQGASSLKLKSVLLTVFFCLSSTVFAEEFPRIEKSISPSLQQNLEHSLERMGLKSAIKSQQLSVALVDITDTHHPRTALINGDHMMYAASLPKIAILFGVFSRIEHEELQLTDSLRERLTKMIRFSSNSAATEMLNLAGKQYLSDLLQSQPYRLYDASHNGGLWVGKEYGRGAAFKRDPLHNLSHGATALQVARFYYLLETNRLVKPDLQDDMKEILSKPGINHKFVKGLNANRPGSDIYRKSGSWKQWHADSALVERDGRKYIAVGLAENAKGGEWLSDMIVAMDDLIMDSTSSVASAESPADIKLASVTLSK